jgi:dolichyl-phosphate beta-glucosyltransferase
MKKPFLSVVIPAYNEENRIRGSIKKIAGYTDTLSQSCEIIVVDDGSQDRTSEWVREMSAAVPGLRILSSKYNRGKGHAVRQGMMFSQGLFSLLTDADLSTPINELKKFLPLMNSPETVLVGNRKISGAEITRHQHFIRERMGKIFTLAGNRILGMKQGDFTCGFKVFGEKARESIFSAQRINGWAYDAEILFLAKKIGFEIKDIPVIWENSDETKVKLIAASMVSFTDLIKIRWNNLSGKYRETTRR